MDLLAVLLITAAAALFWLSGPRRGPIRARPPLTDNEREFFHRLAAALPEYHVFPQVAFSALLTVPRTGDRRNDWAVRSRFSQKVADYVVCERETLDVLAIVELDDRTHDPEKDRLRDAMLEGAGYRVIRFESCAKPSRARIAARFHEELGTKMKEPLTPGS